MIILLSFKKINIGIPDSMNLKTVLVTGGAGYLGSVVSEKLLSCGHSVRVLDNLSYTDIGIKHLYDNPKFQLFKGDIRDEKILDESLNGSDAIIHLAAIANDPSGDLDPELTQSINYRAYNLILAKSEEYNVRRFLNASTFSVYGNKTENNVTEDLSLEPLKEYSICKAKSEVLVKKSNSPKMTTVSLRCATICGWSGRMRFDLIVNTLTYLAIKNRKLIVMGGHQQRPQIHIQDISDYFISLLDSPHDLVGGEIFNAGGENVSILQIAEIIREALGENILLEMVPARDDERSYHVSSEKIFHRIGLKPKRKIKDAVLDILDAYKKGLWVNPEDNLYHNVARMKAQFSGKK